MDDEKPSTKHLVLKPKEITPTDGLSRPGDGTAFSVQLIHAQNKAAEEKSVLRKKSGTPFPMPTEPEPALSPAFKPKTIESVNPMASPDDEEAIHVAEILLENRIAEERSGWKRLRFWRRRKSKRTRDFLVVVGSIDFAIVLSMRLMPSDIVLIYGISGITLATSMIGWIMFFVMDDY